ncbi:uncharacterized protein LOC135496082 isoform X2 [Lineus longissimus]|uniref:uncharacterized protein LOC135496082 isoform X2 n=1 Tax=Lineus longissimus TaxID=88925 RepID=UPI00315D8CF4
MAVIYPRGIMLLVSLSVTLLLVGIAGAEYTNKIYIDENCNDNVTTDGHLAGEVILTRGKGCAATKCHCSFRLTHNDVSKRLKVRFTQLDLGEDSNRQCLGTIKIYSVNGDIKKDKTAAMCTDPNVAGSETLADMNVLYFDVKLGSYDTPKVSMFFTVFHEAKCKTDEFQCALKPYPCVSNSLKCDGYDNCGDKSDEEKETAGCGAIGVTSSTYQLSVITLVAILLLKHFS